MRTPYKIKPLQNKKCLISGAGSGLGRQVAVQLYTQNVELVLIGRDKKKIEQTAEICKKHNPHNQHKLHIVSADLSFWQQAQKAVKESIKCLSGTIDIVFANAGQSMYAKIQDCETAVFEKMISANYYTVLNLIQNALPYLQKSRGIAAATTSIQSIIGVPYHSAYAAAKHAVSGYLSSLELECPEIAVVEIIPGWISGTSLRSTALDGKGKYIKSRASHKIHSRSSVSVEECALAVFNALVQRKRYTYRPKLWRHIPLVKLFLRNLLHKKIVSLQSYGTK